MSITHTPATIKTQLQNDIAAANAATHAGDTTIHDAVNSLIAGYGQSSVFKELTVKENGVFTPAEGVDGFDRVTVEVEGSGGYSPYDDVCFYDYDGSLLYSCTLEEAHDMTSLPEIPDHSTDAVPLISQGWNYTLEEINALNRKADVGAIYNPTDGRTHFTLQMDDKTGLTCTTKVRMGGAGTMYFDWGDGTIATNTVGGSETDVSHSYARNGTYNVTIWCEGSDWTFTRQCLCVEAPEAVVGTFVLGTDVNIWWLSIFMQRVLIGTSVEYVIWSNLYEEPKDMSSALSFSMIGTMPYLQHFNVPRGVKQISADFRNCYQLRRISLPETAVAAIDYFCSGCYRMDRLCLPLGWKNNYDGDIAQRFLLQNYTGEEWTWFFSVAHRDLMSSYTLRKLIVTENVAEIHGDQWCQDSPLEEIYLYPITPPSLGSTSNMWKNIRKNAVVHVPANSLEAYQTATNWSAFASYMVGDL